MTAEADLQRAILEALGADPGVVVWRNNVGMATHTDPRSGRTRQVAYGTGGPGAPDLLVEVRTVVGYVSLWIECKAPAGRLSKRQREWLDAAERRGMRVVVARDVEGVLDAVEGVRVAVWQAALTYAGVAHTAGRAP